MNEINPTDFKTDIAHQDQIQGRLVSGQRFKGKVILGAVDYIHIVELQIEDSSGNFVAEEIDITKLRHDAIMYFGKEE